MVGDPDLKADQVDMTVIDGHVVLIGVVSLSAKVKKIIAIAHATEGDKGRQLGSSGPRHSGFFASRMLEPISKKVKIVK